MFKGEFVIGGNRKEVKDNIVKLYRCKSEPLLGEFKNSIKPGVMGWNGVDGELLYRAEDGKLYRAKFEVIDG